MTRILLTGLLFAALPAFGNDGFGGLTATGLTFGQTKDIQMSDEALSISTNHISVDYVFRNTSAKDVTGEVIFPLPPIPLADLANEDWNLPADRNRADLVNFKASVDGTPAAVTIDRIAVLQQEGWQDKPVAQTYDTPGKDVTAKLEGYGIPLGLDVTAISTLLGTLPLDTRHALIDAGLIASEDDDRDNPNLYPLWSIVLRYHWTQTFPAGAEVKVHHEYQNLPSGGIFTWADPPKDDYLRQLSKRYCIDKGTSKALAQIMAKKQSDGTITNYGLSHDIAYVLRTANSWAGPIGHFKLTLDKGDEANVISLCAQGVQKTGPTTFVWEQTNYVPKADLDILVVAPATSE